MKATIPIKAQTWKRTRGMGNKRYMDASERAYYAELEAYLRRVGFGVLPKSPVELRIVCLEFHFKDKRWRDIDNLLKGFLDAGQPSKWWIPERERRLVQDLWDDKQFCAVDRLRRIRGSDGDYIIIEVEQEDSEGAKCKGGDEYGEDRISKRAHIGEIE